MRTTIISTILYSYFFTVACGATIQYTKEVSFTIDTFALINYNDNGLEKPPLISIKYRGPKCLTIVHDSILYMYDGYVEKLYKYNRFSKQLNFVKISNPIYALSFYHRYLYLFNGKSILKINPDTLNNVVAQQEIKELKDYPENYAFSFFKEQYLFIANMGSGFNIDKRRKLYQFAYNIETNQVSKEMDSKNFVLPIMNCKKCDTLLLDAMLSRDRVHYVGQSNDKILFWEDYPLVNNPPVIEYNIYIYDKSDGNIYKIKKSKLMNSLIFPESAVFIEDNTFVMPQFIKNSRYEPVSFLYLVVKLDM